MFRLIAFTSLGLSVGAAFYGHHSAVWVLLSALFSASMLIPDEASMDDAALTRRRAKRLAGTLSEECLLEMHIH